MQISYWVMVAITTGVWALGVWAAFLSNRVHVRPGNIERAVIDNIYTGRLEVKGPGMYYLLPWMRIFQKVNTNRETAGFGIADSAREEVRCSDGAFVSVEGWYYIIAGRRFNRDNGQLERVYDLSSAIDDGTVVYAVTTIDYNQYREVVDRSVRASIEEVVGMYESGDLLLPTKNTPQIPRRGDFIGGDMSWVLDAVDPETGQPMFFDFRGVQNSAAVYHHLSRLVELYTNHKLRICGLNVVSVHITDLAYKDPKMQAALEMNTRARRLREAFGDRLQLAEQMAFSESPGQVAGVAGAEAFREIARELRQAAPELIRLIKGEDGG